MKENRWVNVALSEKLRLQCPRRDDDSRVRVIRTYSIPSPVRTVLCGISTAMYIVSNSRYNLYLANVLFGA